MAWRVFPWDPAAKAGEPFSPSYVHPKQGSGRFDVSGKLVLYLAESAAHAVAEKLQRFRGQKLDRKDLLESGRTLALVECTLDKKIVAKIADLCDPAVLLKHQIAPDVLASRETAKTQRIAGMLHDAGFAGLRWWSALSGDWHTVVLFLDRVHAGDLEYGKPQPLTIDHKAVQEATA